jgi:hypothetical protein
MGVRHRGSFGQMKRDARRALERGIRDLTREAHQEIRRETPRRTGRLANAWQEQQRGLTGIVGNTESHAPVVALGRRDRPMSGRERRNVGFHERGLRRALARSERIFRKAFRSVF